MAEEEWAPQVLVPIRTEHYGNYYLKPRGELLNEKEKKALGWDIIHRNKYDYLIQRGKNPEVAASETSLSATKAETTRKRVTKLKAIDHTRVKRNRGKVREYFSPSKDEKEHKDNYSQPKHKHKRKHKRGK